jgi:peroxiredoxin
MVSAYSLYAESPTVGSGSAITNSYGLYVAAQTAGTTNYAIYTNTGHVYFGDVISVGVTPSTSRSVYIGGGNVLTQGGGINQYGLVVNPLAGTDASSAYSAIYVLAKANGSVTSLYGIQIDTATKVSGTTTTNYGLYINDQTVGATNYALYAGAGWSRFSDVVAIGVAPLAKTALYIGGGNVLTQGGGGSQFGVSINPLAGTDASSAYSAIYVLAKANGSVTSLYGIQIDTATKVSGTTTTNYGLYINDQTVGATNYALYAGAGWSRFSDVVAIGAAPLAKTVLYIGGGNVLTQGGGASQFGVSINPLAGTDASSAYYAVYLLAKANGSITNLYGLYIDTNTKASGTTTTNYGLYISDQTVGATNYALYAGVGLASYNDTTDSTSITTGSVALVGGMGIGKRLTLDGSSGKTLRITNKTVNAAVAVTLGSTGPTGSTAGAPQGWMRIDIAGTDRYIPFW